MSTCHVLWSHRDLNIKNNSLIRYICQLLQNSGVLLVNILFINVNKCSLSHKLKTIEHILENIKYRQEAMPPSNIKTFSKLSEPSLNSKRNFSSSYIFRKESIRCSGKNSFNCEQFFAWYFEGTERDIHEAVQRIKL